MVKRLDPARTRGTVKDTPSSDEPRNASSPQCRPLADPEKARGAGKSLQAETHSTELAKPTPGQSVRAHEAARLIESCDADPDELVAALEKRDPTGRYLLAEVMAQLNDKKWSKSDNVARRLLARRGSAWMATLPGEAKVQIARAVREGRITDADFDVFNAVVPLPLGVCSLAFPREVEQARAMVAAAKGSESSLTAALMAHIERNPDSPVLELVIRRLPFASSDNVTRGLVAAIEDKVGAQQAPGYLARLPLGARYQMVKALREGVVTDADRAAWSKLHPMYRKDLLRAGVAALGKPEVRRAARDFLVARGETTAARTVEFAGRRLSRLGRPAARLDGDQALLDLCYRNIAVLPLSKEEVDAASTIDLVRTADGKPLHLPDTTVFRPGLAGPSLDAAAAFYLARHTDRLVVAYANDDETAASRLRLANTYDGYPVPEGIELYVVGRPEHVLQSAASGSDVLTGQLERIRTDGPALGLELDLDRGVWLMAHSQGNVESVLTATRLAAAGLRPFAGIYGMSPALHGSPIADTTPAGEIARLVGYLIAGPQGYDAVAGLDPDALGLLYMGLTAEALPASEDLSFHGSVEVGGVKARSLLMRATGFFADNGLGESSTDGMVSGSSAGGSKHDVLSSQPDDHLTMIKGGTDPMRRFLGALATLADAGELETPTPVFDALAQP